MSFIYFIYWPSFRHLERVQCEGSDSHLNLKSINSIMPSTRPRSGSLGSLFKLARSLSLRSRSSNSTVSLSSDLDHNRFDASLQQLPPDVWACIADHLRGLYTNLANESCESCLLHNLAFAARACKSWHAGLVPVM
jgi:hypothetical protein